ncbi:AAA family ATPase [Aestuariivivens sediminis]|uniref:AAA family ATPase n=1 Tax=Aestuariivivens sediminis TaxID=2913557 RepID=UPI0023EED4F1|nr:AAA family ATPase [Aestuariivivens sediminis]
MFEKVRKEHIIQGIRDYKEKGLPKGFGPSSTYDLFYNNEPFPPKAIMAYANYYATGAKPTNNFPGGEGTECFLALKREGFTVDPKNFNLMKNNQSMTLEELAVELNSLNVSKKFFNVICNAFVLKNDQNIHTADATVKVAEVRIKIGWDTHNSVTKGRIEQDCLYFPNEHFYQSIKDFAYAIRNNELTSDYENSIHKYPSKKRDIETLIELLNQYVFNENNKSILPNINEDSEKPYDIKKALSIAEWSDIILDFLIQKRTQIPDLKFGLRQQNRNNRLDEGYWFQGNERYLSVGFSKIGAGNHATKSIGFVLEINSEGEENCRIEIVFKKEKDDKILACFDRIINTLEGFKRIDEKAYMKKYENPDVLKNLEKFLTVEKPIIDGIINEMGLVDKMIFSDEKFNKMLNKVLEIRNNKKSSNPFKIILANITWNSKDWKEISEDVSGHAWVGGDNIPQESWNFDFDNPRNKDNKIYGYVKFTNAPSVSGDNNLVIFYSKGKIVGFYGKTEILKEWVNLSDKESYNLIANKDLCVVLPNKIEDIKEKGYLEDLNRVGQVGFSYLKKDQTAINILDEAMELNPELKEKLNDIKNWVVDQNSMKEKFKKWLEKGKIESGKVSSYLRAIDILINNFNVKVYSENDLNKLNDLYEDLLLHQNEVNGKYYYQEAPSYGQSGFFSAAIGQYIEFLNNTQLEESDNDFTETINHYNQEELKYYFDYLDEVVAHLGLKQGDKRVVYSCKGLYLNFNIGQRFAWRLEEKNGNDYLLMTAEKLNENYHSFDGNLSHYFTRFKGFNITPEMKDSSFRAFEEELKRTEKSGMLRHNNKDFERAVFDKAFRSQFINTTSMEYENRVLNKILFGPPGTGKTFNTVNEALKIVDQNFYQENENDRKALNKRFKELLIKNWDKTDGQIAFCTFHQSFSYEDFVEGIKPKTNEKKEVFYEIEDGVFKKICQLADSSISAVKMKKEGKLSWNEETFRKASFYKLSLGDSTKSEDKAIYDYCIENNVIALGYGNDNDFSGLSEGQITEKCEDLDLESNAAQSLNYFIHYIKNGNYVVIGSGNKYVRALAKVNGDYMYDPTTPIRYNHFRKVEWIFKDENIPIEEIYNRGLSQQTIYKLDEHGLKKDFFVNHGQNIEPEAKKIKDYVLIIDEINRGNVSSIFGELITLIEKDKRAGGNEELEVTLPYSKDPFKVPHNVYIIGTMNTADRSIEALDTALRRRFSFDEKPPQPNLILTEGNSGKVNGMVDGINLKTLLERINNRIEKLIDKDHKIGHSYFLKVNSKESLVHCFENEVIPLLEEYFFGDYGKIGLVLGDSFIAKDDSEAFEFANFDGYDTDISSDLKERSVYKIRPSREWHFNSI